MNFFSERIEAIRVAKNLSVGEVLALLDISPSMLSMIRNGKRKPSVRTMRRIEDAEVDLGLREAPKQKPPQPVLRDSSANYSQVDRDILAVLEKILACLDNLEKIISEKRGAK